MNFAEYLISKNIDGSKFESGDKTIFDVWQNEFEVMHPKSFTAQKLFLINSIRRKYQLHIGAKPKEKSTKLIDNETSPTTEKANITKPIFKKDSITQPETAPLPLEDTPKKFIPKPLIKKTTSDTTNIPNDDTSINITSKPKPIFKRPETNVEQKEHTDLAEDPNLNVKPKAPKPIFKRPQPTTDETKPLPEENSEVEKISPTKKMAPKPIFKRTDLNTNNNDEPLNPKTEN